MKKSIQIFITLNIILHITPLIWGMEKTIIAVNSTEITKDTPVKLTSLLHSFMRGKFEARADGTLFYDHYADTNIIYQDTIKEFHDKLLAVHRSVEYLCTGLLLLDIQQKNPFSPILLSRNEYEKSEIALLAFSTYMNNQDLPDNFAGEEIKQNRDDLKKAIMAIREGKEVAEVAARINEARLKKLIAD